MLLLKHFRSNTLKLTNVSNLKFCARTNFNVANLKKQVNKKVIDKNVISSDLIELLDKHHSSILYSSFIEERRKALGYVHRRKTLSLGQYLERREQAEAELKALNEEPLPFCLKYITDVQSNESNTNNAGDKTVQTESTQETHFPFKSVTDTVTESNIKNDEVAERIFEDRTVELEAEVRFRQETCTDEKVMNWMVDYENYDDSVTEEVSDNSWKYNYGTPDPKSQISNVPCGGCGALLHCKVNFYLLNLQ